MPRWPWVMVRRKGVPTVPTFSMDDTARRRRERHNERVKLLATAMNALAIGLVTTGVAGPLVALFLRNPDKPLSTLSISVEALAFMGIWSGLGLALHLGAHFVLRGLR